MDFAAGGQSEPRSSHHSRQRGLVRRRCQGSRAVAATLFGPHGSQKLTPLGRMLERRPGPVCCSGSRYSSSSHGRSQKCLCNSRSPPGHQPCCSAPRQALAGDKPGLVTEQAVAGVGPQLCTVLVAFQQGDVLFETVPQNQAAGHELGPWDSTTPGGASVRLAGACTASVDHRQGSVSTSW